MSGALEMPPSFTRGEYWLLEAVVSHRLPVHWLDWDELAEAVNKKAHGMSRELLVETLLGLFTAGLVEADTSKAEHLSLNAAQIEAALDKRSRDSRANYGLTPKGGAQWEAFAAPCWEGFVGDSCDWPVEKIPGLEKVDLVCQDRGTVERYFESMQHYYFDIVQGSVQWDILKPWQATYWKELPSGHRLRFDGKRKPEIEEEWPPRPVHIGEICDHGWYPWR